MKPLDRDLYALVVTALHKYRVAKRAAEETGVSNSCAWRIAKRENIALVELSEHQRKRLADPVFRAKQKKAARDGASAWLRKMHEQAGFHRKATEAARKNLLRLNRDPAFRAASAARLKQRYADPAFRKKQAEAASAAQRLRHSKAHLRLNGQSMPISPAGAPRALHPDAQNAAPFIAGSLAASGNGQGKGAARMA
jgi:hypothetical protein